MLVSLNRYFVRFLLLMAAVYWRAIYLDFRRRYEVSPGFRFNGKNILLYGDGRIVLGECSYIGGNSTVQASLGCSVVIGWGCHISSNVRIFTESMRADSDLRIKPVPSKSGDVLIGDACWIGANVLVNPGVRIGENSVVGANSVVVKDIPPNEIWGGVPAKLIRKKSFQLHE
ncbi:maltose O-acetyltransferase [Atopomonas hussainii]|uniref:Maltose O-acetyltransferase n=1 Tax=Atopomonas hussainii TaxID=1429083 RepID=A0A1H7P1Y3_9GAMM|nr:acyltransferase [Atopomonas hussainii]SEL29609.1 maltose O-acetyltransferase [Atopomonas hussainii]